MNKSMVIPAKAGIYLDRFRVKHGMTVLIIIIFGLFGAKALFHPGFYSSHDGEHQLVRQFVFEQGLKDGQIPVRFSRQLYNGYGYPLFMFTYRLPFYAGEVFRLTGFSFADSIKAVFFAAYIASGLAMFWFGRRWGNFAGVIAAILYMWAPYRFSVMFVRAALGEHTAAVFVPLLFGSVFSSKKGKINVVLGAAAIAGLFLSHAMMAQIVLIMVLVGSLTKLFVRRLLSAARISSTGAEPESTPVRLMLRVRRAGEVLSMFVLGLGLAAYYLVPAAAYRGLTQKLNPNYFADHFVTLRQLIYSPWGYTFSMKGTENDGMSFQVGPAQWAAVAVVIPALSWNLSRIKSGTSYRFRVKRGMTPSVIRRKDQIFRKDLILPASLIFIFVISIFLMTEKSAFVWNWWKNYINIDMPWRFLLMTTFSGSALAGIAYKSYKNYNHYIAYSAMIILVGLAVYANRNHLRVNEYLDYPDSRLTQYRGTSNSDNEYRPKWDDAGITRSFLGEAKISTGSGQLTVVRSKSNLLQVAGNFDEDSRIDLNILYFPGWEVEVDGQKWPFKYAGEGGIIRVDVPAGYHMIEAKYRETGLMKFADGISLGSLVWLGVEVNRWRKRKK